MKKIYLIDCPGVVYNPAESDEEKVLKGVVRVEMVENPADYISAVLAKVKKEYLARTYRVSSNWNDHDDFLERVAQKYGKLLKGGEPDVNTIAKMVLNHWQRGKIPYFVPPIGCQMPPKPSAEDAADQDNKIKKDQDFSQIKVLHEYDPEDLQDMSINESEGANAEEPANTEEINNAVKKRKNDDEADVQTGNERKKRRTEKIKTASGVFTVTDNK